MKQQLSALIDGEGDLERCEHIVLAAKSEGDMAYAWHSYHLIGDVMRNEAQPMVNMRQRVLDALDEEPTVLAPASLPSAALAKPSAPAFSDRYSWSIAASIAAAFFVGLFVLTHQPATQVMQIADNAAEPYVMAHHNYAPSSSTYYVHNVAYNGQ